MVKLRSVHGNARILVYHGDVVGCVAPGESAEGESEYEHEYRREQECEEQGSLIPHEFESALPGDGDPFHSLSPLPVREINTSSRVFFLSLTSIISRSLSST